MYLFTWQADLLTHALFDTLEVNNLPKKEPEWMWKTATTKYHPNAVALEICLCEYEQQQHQWEITRKTHKRSTLFHIMTQINKKKATTNESSRNPIIRYGLCGTYDVVVAVSSSCVWVLSCVSVLFYFFFRCWRRCRRRRMWNYFCAPTARSAQCLLINATNVRICKSRNNQWAYYTLTVFACQNIVALRVHGNFAKWSTNNPNK